VYLAEGTGSFDLINLFLNGFTCNVLDLILELLIDLLPILGSHEYYSPLVR
jgi:hypothetical protein